MNETLRVCSPASSRFPRINDYASTEYGQWSIPARVIYIYSFCCFSDFNQTPMSMNIWNVHRSEIIFPDAETFRPERWLSEDAGKLENYFVPFGSGSRMCIGMK